MAAIFLSDDCSPQPIRIGDLTIPALPPNHENCSGGHTMPGVIGGWTCPCPCHNERATASPPTNPEPSVGRLVVKVTKEWVVEVDRTKIPSIMSWDVWDVKAACEITPDGVKTEWLVLDPDSMTSADAMSLKVWRRHKAVDALSPPAQREGT